MKNPVTILCLAVLASACSSSPSDLSKAAVTSYLKKTLDDPTSYQAVRWGKVTPYLRTEADRQEFGQLMAACKIQQDSLIDGIQGEVGNSEMARLQKAVDASTRPMEVLAKKIDREEAAKDSSRVGVTVRHTFRAKNKMGALVLDSARFIVLNSGVITVTK